MDAARMDRVRREARATGLRRFAEELDGLADAVARAPRRGGRLSALEALTIALEDRRFLTHAGLDVRSVLRETVHMALGRRHGGASTIEMQLVRTLTGRRERTLGRKLHETALAMALARRCEKLAMLRAYLGCAYFGTGLTGAEAAARLLFAKPADHLDIEEAALVSAMLACPRPRLGSPRWEARVARRAAYGLDVFAQLSAAGRLPGAPDLGGGDAR